MSIPNHTIAFIAGVSSADVSNYHAGGRRRERYVSPAKREAIEKAMAMSQTDLIVWHFETFHDTLTQAYAGVHYHIGRLSERVRELNKRWHRTGEKRFITNTAPLGFGVVAVYKLEEYK